MVGLIVLLVSLALACGSSGSSSSGGNEQSESKPAEPAVAEPARSYAVGEDVTVGEVHWKVLESKDLGKELKSDNEFMKPKTTGGKFVLIRLEVENQKDKAASYAGVNLVDSKDRTFERYTEQFGYIPENETCMLEQLNPNIVKTCSEIFELPGDANGIKVKLGDLEIFGGKEALVELGF
jgi:hypothetical protein